MNLNLLMRNRILEFITKIIEKINNYYLFDLIMKLLFISYLVIFIIKIYCLIPDYHPDQIALLILSSGSWSDLCEENDIIGNIVKDINGNPLSINIKGSGEPEEYASIVDIIPSLRNLEPDELTEKFSKIYKLAFATFYNTFETGGEDDIILDDSLIKKIINENDLINALINPSQNSNLLQDPKYDGRLFLSTDTEKNNALKEFINSLKSEDVSNIDINKFNELPDEFKEKWNDDESLPKLYKAIGIQCAKTEDCINQFQDEDNQTLQDISFNIVRYTYNDNDENMYNYSFIIINNKLRNVYHAFTLESDKNDNFKLNEHDSTYNSVSFDYINNYYVINSENIKKRKENEIVIEKGIGLLAECGLIYEDDVATYNPEYYGYKFEEIEDEDKEKVNELDERLLQFYDLNQDDGTYNSNIIINIFNSYLVSVEPVNDDTDNQNISFVKSKTQNDNILCSYTNDHLAHIEELALRFIEARKFYNAENSEDNAETTISKRNKEKIELLPDIDIYIINRLFEIIILKKTVKYDGGIFHYNNDSELINDYTEYTITKNILHNIDIDINECKNNNQCSINSSIIVDFDIERSYKNFMEIINNKNLEKRVYPFNGNTNDSFILKTTSEYVKSLIVEYKRIGPSLTAVNSIKYFINPLYTYIAGVKDRYAKAEYKDRPAFKYINEEEIVKLEHLYSTLVQLHKKYFRSEDQLDIANIRNYIPIQIDTNSKYTYDKIYDLLSSASELISIYDPNDDGTNTRLEYDDNSEVTNYEAIMNRLKELKIDEKLENIFDNENRDYLFDPNSYENFVSNSQLIYGMKESLNSFVKNNYSNENGIIKNRELKSFNDNHEQNKIIFVNKYVYHQGNIRLNFKDFCQVEQEEIINDPNGIKYLKQYSDLLKSNIKNDKISRGGRKLSNKLKTDVDNLRKLIVQKIDDIDHHYENAKNIPALMNAFNDILNTINEYSVDESNTDKIRGLYLEDFQKLNLESRLKYVALDHQYKAIDKAIKDYPNYFRLPKEFKTFKDYVYNCNSGSDAKEIFDKNEIYYFTPSDVNNILVTEGENPFVGIRELGYLETVPDYINMFSILLSDNGENNDELINLENYSEIQRHILNNNPSIKRDEVDIESVEKTSRLINSKYLLKGYSMKPLETDKTSFERYKNDLIYKYNLAELNNYLTVNGISNEITRVIQSCISNEAIFNKLNEYDINLNNNKNEEAILYYDRDHIYAYIDFNKIGDGTSEIQIFNELADKARYYEIDDYFRDLSKRAENMEKKN
ncbi:hypothetical protein LY90DRAFT_515737 [Neocallimastix californiae]|uniref:Uncharacterized protein n=1 Tax=Neocallimastix californiae TaxID=1754190 RepID=A0A1Y2AI15_9FUNG|nr:hypothetical protein LY90DRAFT_515737 [Neocallimastix californiae]|eukprot:ORY22104.1 hypothetical protein LY90DRAFT_515737 [Neocallimastix californiae]